MNTQKKKWLWWVATALLLGVGASFAWQRYGDNKVDGLTSGNGRIEATEIAVAAKNAGRIKEILVREGDFVTAGQVVARMDTDVLEAQLREAKAQQQRAHSTAATAHSQLVQREAEKAAALAVVTQHEAALTVAQKRLKRTLSLVVEDMVPQQKVDDDRAQVQSTSATVAAARAQVVAAEAAIVAARTQITGAEFGIEAAQASVQRIQADVTDSALSAPQDGRVQYRVAQPGEVLSAGGRVLNLVDLTDTENALRSL